MFFLLYIVVLQAHMHVHVHGIPIHAKLEPDMDEFLANWMGYLPVGNTTLTDLSLPGTLHPF